MMTRIARFISILGNPVLLMPITAALATNATGDHRVQFLSVVIAIVFAMFVFIYSQVKARSGQWKHVDASMKHERRELNLIAGAALLFGALVLFLLNVYSGVVFAVGLSGVIVLFCHFFSKVAKPSLHFGFAIFAACLMFPNKIAAALFLLFAISIGWSRLHLERHSLLDLVLGAAIGFFAGGCFQFMTW